MAAEQATLLGCRRAHACVGARAGHEKAMLPGYVRKEGKGGEAWGWTASRPWAEMRCR